MSSRIKEKLTLHFDLSHCPADAEFSLGASGKRYALTRHTPESFARHSQTNKALALIPPERQGRVTHYAEDVEMPADAVGIHLVTFPNEDPNRIPELALSFVHIPTAAKRAHFRRRRKGAYAEAFPSSLTHFGVAPDALDPLTASAVKLDATQVITPFQAAETIIFNHPDLLTARQEVAATVIYNHIDAYLQQDRTLPDYLSAHGPGTPDPFYSIVTATNPQTGQPINPVSTDANGNPILDKDGNPLTWPQQNGQNVVQQYQLSTGVVGTTDGTQQGVAYTPLAKILQTTKNDAALNGQSWSVQHGITSTRQSNVQPPPTAPKAGLAAESLPAAGSDPGFKWHLSNKTSIYGLDVDDKSVTYDVSTSTLTFNVKNWANRYLGAYVRFYDEGGNQLGDTDYITKLSPGNTLAGIPIWTNYTPLGFTVPASAAKADVLLGGLGIGNTDEVDVLGVVYTGLFNFAVPTFLIGLSVGTTGLRLVLNNLEDMSITVVINAVEAFLGAPSIIISALSDPKSLISTFGEIAVGVIFSKGLDKLAAKITGYVTTTELLEKAPIVGWTFQVLSCAAGIADILATTVEVLLSPATYTVEATRTIDLQVYVAPDPTHGTPTQPPVWPLESDHWEVVVQYKGGTSLQQSGSMASVKPDSLLSVLFSGVPAAPGAQIQVTANIYSATDWLCGKWSSTWVAALAPDGDDKLTLQGSIIEFLVPLTAQTQYSHYQKLAYQDGHHVWEQTTTPPPEVFSGSTDCPESGNVLCRLVNVTINDLAYALAYTYQASGQGLPVDSGSGPQDGQIYAFQSISVLGDPEAGMKQPTQGFLLAPYITYDQFGPAPLFALQAATYQSELDGANGQPVPADVATAFANAGGAAGAGTPGTGSGNYTLPAGATVTVVTAGAEWQIGTAAGMLYDLRRETDTINVFSYPTPAFSPRNYFVDSSAYATDNTYQLRQVTLGDGSGTFNYATGQSWGAFLTTDPLDAFVVHPNGYVIGVSYEYSKLLIVQLPAGAVADADAPRALPMSGAGVREGLMQGPKALTVTPDGRVLVLEQDNARIQAFDTMGNPVQCFAGPLAFTLDAGFRDDLNSGSVSDALLQAYQQNVQPQLAPSFSLPSTSAADLNAGNVTDDLKQQFADNALPLSAGGPFQVLTTPPGNVWLLVDEGSGLSFDIRKNLYVNSGGQELFTLPASLIPGLNAGTASPALILAFADYGVTLSPAGERQVVVVNANTEWILLDTGAKPEASYVITVESNVYVYQGSALLFSLPAGVMSEVSPSDPLPQDLLDQFSGHGINLSSSLRLNVVTAGSAWQLVDEGNGVTYDINTEPDLDVFHAPAFEIDVVAQDSEWDLRDTVNTLTFAIKADANNPGLLDAQQLVSVLGLKDGVGADVTYLDIGVEAKGFIYVLSYEGAGSAQSDYHLDIYNPDGTWLARTPESAGDPGVNGAKMVVDQWRNVYTLNYEAILGPDSRTEPSVSTWIPSTPQGDGGD